MNTEDPDGGVPAATYSDDELPPTKPKPKELPADLPKSLNDRRAIPEFTAETEMYDAWQGASPDAVKNPTNIVQDNHSSSLRQCWPNHYCSTISPSRMILVTSLSESTTATAG